MSRSADGHGRAANAGAESGECYLACPHVGVPGLVPPLDVSGRPLLTMVEDQTPGDNPVLDEDLAVRSDLVPSITDASNSHISLLPVGRAVPSVILPSAIRALWKEA